MMAPSGRGVLQLLDTIWEQLREADSQLSLLCIPKVPKADCERATEMARSCVQVAYTQALVLLELVGLTAAREMVAGLNAQAETDTAGFGRIDMGPDEPYLYYAAKLWPCISAVEAGFRPNGTGGYEVDDLAAIVRRSVYEITGTTWASPPTDEWEVDKRIEAILRPIYPDLDANPSVPKPGTNPQPDTALRRRGTLLEYKYVDAAKKLAIIEEEIRADTRGYDNAGWREVIFVVYETERFRSEEKWNEVLRADGVPEHMTVVVLPGVPRAIPSTA